MLVVVYKEENNKMKFTFIGIKDVVIPKPPCPICKTPHPKVTKIGKNFLCKKCNHIFPKPEKYYIYSCEKHGKQSFEEPQNECPLCKEEGEQSE